ncbi:MAG: hypothetical protein MI757_22795 [Pirellulales bacterium]|nr:hypothetical protein [Pirellulales bacterium]
MDDTLIFAVGCAVFGIVIASAFVAVIASDDPNAEYEATQRSKPPLSSDSRQTPATRAVE